jgi:hypothetical protein
METRGHMLDRIRQAVCGMHGHDSLLQFEQERMFLKCASCGYETPGWELNEAPPTATLDGNVREVRPRAADPRVTTHPQFIGERRVA